MKPIALMFLLGLLTATANADDDKFARASLVGLKGLAIVLEALPPEVEAVGLQKEQVQTDVELKLRLAGISVLAESPTYIYIYTNFLTESEPWAYNLVVELRQNVQTEKGIFLVGVPTWSIATLCKGGSLNFLKSFREQLRDLMDIFINAYLSVNPKK